MSEFWFVLWRRLSAAGPWILVLSVVIVSLITILYATQGG